MLCVVIYFQPINSLYEPFYEFRIPTSLNRTIMFQLSDKNIDQYYEKNHIFTPPYETVVCK